MDNLKSTNLPCHIAEIKEGPYREKYLYPHQEVGRAMDGSSIGQIYSPSKKFISFSTDIDRMIRELTLSVQQKEPQSGDQICTQHLSNPRL